MNQPYIHGGYGFGETASACPCKINFLLRLTVTYGCQICSQSHNNQCNKKNP